MFREERMSTKVTRSLNATSKDLCIKPSRFSLMFRNNKATPLECWTQVRNFRASVERAEQSHYHSSY